MENLFFFVYFEKILYLEENMRKVKLDIYLIILLCFVFLCKGNILIRLDYIGNLN